MCQISDQVHPSQQWNLELSNYHNESMDISENIGTGYLLKFDSISSLGYNVFLSIIITIH